MTVAHKRAIVQETLKKEAKMRFFGLKTCDTCRKALKSLGEAGITPDVIDVRADGVSAEDRAAMIAAFGDKVINRASTTWRGLSDDEKAADPADLIAAHPTLIKRPVIETDGQWFQGWSKSVQTEILG